ncbi:hypothetical protein E2320_003993 [Naja naja]|nr:hypothetical protein E2320_003993 [Naja naja]
MLKPRTEDRLYTMPRKVSVLTEVADPYQNLASECESTACWERLTQRPPQMYRKYDFQNSGSRKAPLTGRHEPFRGPNKTGNCFERKGSKLWLPFCSSQMDLKFVDIF